jgi:hypothetical protein
MQQDVLCKDSSIYFELELIHLTTFSRKWRVLFTNGNIVDNRPQNNFWDQNELKKKDKYILTYTSGDIYRINKSYGFLTCKAFGIGHNPNFLH